MEHTWYFSKIPHLQQYIDEKSKIICLQETWFKTENKPFLRGYQHPSARKDRDSRRGGGVCIFVANCLPYDILPIVSELEATAIQLYMENSKISICSIYISPDFCNKDLSKKLDSLCANIPKPYIVTMDANAHHSSWGSNYSEIDGWVEENGLVLLNLGQPTYKHTNGSLTHIDLTVASSEMALKLEWELHTDNFGSDHFPINIINSCSDTPLTPQHYWKLRQQTGMDTRLESTCLI